MGGGCIDLNVGAFHARRHWMYSIDGIVNQLKLSRSFRILYI
jgi:hypothetical protein